MRVTGFDGSYADFVTAVRAFGNAGPILYRVTGSGAEIAAFIPQGVVTYNNVNTPSEATLLADFPHAVEVTADFAFSLPTS